MATSADDEKRASIAELHQVRDAFGDLLVARPEAREAARQAHARYTAIVARHREGEKAKQARRIGKVRKVLQRGRLVEKVSGKARGLEWEIIRGLFPKDLVERSPLRRRTQPGPQAEEASWAKAALEALDWAERLKTAPDEEERIRRWTEWTEGYRAGRMVEHLVDVGYVAPPGTEPSPSPARRDWAELRGLPLADRLTMAWTWLGGLWDALSLDPIVATASEPQTPIERMMEWVAGDAVQPRTSSREYGVPDLDPEKLSPALAWLFLELVEAHIDDESSATGSPSATAEIPPTAIPERRQLSDKAAAVYEMLRDLPPHRALTGSEILKRLSARTPPLHTDQSTLTTYIIPELRPYGVVNQPRIGYFLLGRE